MDETNKEMTQEEAEKDFKENMFSIFSEKLEGVHRDKDGFIVIPRTTIKSAPTKTTTRARRSRTPSSSTPMWCANPCRE